MSQQNRKNSGYSISALISAASAVAATMLPQLAARAGSTTQPSSGVTTVYNGPSAPIPATYNAPVPGDINGNIYATISLSGSTAMRNYTTSSGISQLPTNTDIFLSSGSFFGSSNPNTAIQLAPSNTASSGTNQVPAVRLEWHEQGSVEGILEMVTDQIGAPSSEPLSLANVSRSPSATNPTWINTNKLAAPGTLGGFTIANFDSSNPLPNGSESQSPVQMAISDVKPIQGFSYTTTVPGVTPAPAGTPAWALTPGQAGYGQGNTSLSFGGGSNNGGLGLAGARETLEPQSALNMTTSMIDPTTKLPYTSGPWNTGGVTNLQTNTVAVTATTFSANPGTGMTGLNKTDAQWLQLTGRLTNGATFNMSTRDTNSGTRNSAANNTGIDPSWAVGVNDSGNVLATTASTIATADLQDAIGVDANGNAAMRFSGKTSGSLLRQTVVNNRMAIGTLSLPDALSTDGAATSTPMRVLAYNAGTDQTKTNFIYPTAQSISDGSYAIWQQEQYVTVKAPNATFANASASTWATTSDLQTGIKGDTGNVSVSLSANVTIGSNVVTGGNITDGGFVVGQKVFSSAFPSGTTVTGISYVDNGNSNTTATVASITLSNPAVASSSVSAGSGTISDFQVGGGDVANFRANILNSQVIAGTNAGFASNQNPGDQLVNQGFVLPQFMQVQKAYDGGPVTANSTFDINSNPTGYNSTAAGFFLGSGNNAILVADFTPDEARLNSATPISGDVNVTQGTPNTVPTASAGGYYGQSIRAATSINGVTIPGQSPVAFTAGNVGITADNYLFGNFNNNGIRDYNSFKTGVAALTALYTSGLGTDVNVNPAGMGTATDETQIPDSALNTTLANLDSVLGSTSTFIGQRGSSGASDNDLSQKPITATGASKGDLIVMGDYNGDGRFDGKDIYAMAIGTTLSENYSTDRLTTMDDVRTGVLNKNGALDYVQSNTAGATYGSNSVATNAAGFIRQSNAAVLTAPTLPSGATQLYTGTDANNNPIVGFTFDPTGTNAFNKSDVNRDGIVDMNDAVAVDQFNGQSFGNLQNQLAATIPTPVTGTSEPVSLVIVQQVDNESAIGAADLAVINGGLTGIGNANWYGDNLQKTGPGTINWARSGGTVTVYGGASYEVSSGVTQVTGSLDPFSDTTTGTTTSGNHVAVSVDHGAKLQFTQPGLTSTVKSLTIDTSSGASVNVGPSTLAIDFSSPASDPVATIRGYLQSGYKNDTWTGSGIVSSNAQANPGLYSVGYVDGNTDIGTPAAANQILIRNTLAGDSNFDGVVNFPDLLVVAQNFGKTGEDWAQGDFNYDGIVNFPDLLLIAQNFGKVLNANQLSQLPGSFSAEWELAETEISAAGPSSVPEPATTSLIAISAAGLLARRRRRA